MVYAPSPLPIVFSLCIGNVRNSSDDFKGTEHHVITHNNCYHKNLLGNKQLRAVDSIKHWERRLTLKIVFEKEVISH